MAAMTDDPAAASRRAARLQVKDNLPVRAVEAPERHPSRPGVRLDPPAVREQ